MNFASDNWAGASPKILDALVKANHDNAPAYGSDQITARVQQKFCEIFERDVEVFFVGHRQRRQWLCLVSIIAALRHDLMP